MKPLRKILIWDAPTRLFHWALVLLVGACWVTQWRGWMEWHFLCGESILVLLIFRVIWGFVGSDTARFTFFLKSPLEALRHLSHLRRREPDTELGHNAAGGWMVLGLLGVLALQVGTGLFANDDDSFIKGPLRHLVSKDISETANLVHNLTFDLIQIAVLLHVAAVIMYFVLKGHNLVRPMIFGSKDIPEPVTLPRQASLLRAAVILIIAAGIVSGLVRFL